MEDTTTGLLREAYLHEGRLERVLFFGAALPPRDWLVAAFEAPVLTEDMRRWLLIGRAPGTIANAGPIVCACAGVSKGAIETAIRKGALTLDAIGEATRAGVNCGSCRPELRGLLSAATEKEASHAA